MSQLAAISLTATPKRISEGLSGCYLAQPRPRSASVLYATRTTAPTNTDDYFRCTSGNFFTFATASGATWARALDPLVPVKLALAKLDD